MSSMHAARIANPIDIHVGSRIRLRRKMLGMTQEQLGNQVGITFQQIQKYERGTNRIGAGRLWQLADAMEVPINFFYDGLGGPVYDALPTDSPQAAEPKPPEFDYDFLNSPDGRKLADAVSRISKPEMRRKLIEMAELMADKPAEKSTD